MTTTHDHYYDKLDRLLGFFYAHRNGRPITMNSIQDSKIVSSDRQELIRLVQKLIQDNRVDLIEVQGLVPESIHTLHKITLDGIIFHESNSYKKEHLSNMDKKTDKGGHDLSHTTFNNSTVIFDATISKSTIDNSQTKNIKQITSTNINQENSIKTLFKKFWWAFIIPIAVGLILLAIEYKWFGKTELKQENTEMKNTIKPLFKNNDSIKSASEIKSNIINQTNSPNSNAQIGTNNTSK